MLLKEMNFRDIVDKYLYIDAAGVAQNLGSIFEVTEDATGVLCYGYIDEQASALKYYAVLYTMQLKRR